MVAGDPGFDLESFLEGEMVSASDRDTHDNTADDQLDHNLYPGQQATTAAAVPVVDDVTEAPAEDAAQTQAAEPEAAPTGYLRASLIIL